MKVPEKLLPFINGKLKANNNDRRLAQTLADISTWTRHAVHFYGNAIAHPWQVASLGPTFPYVARQISELAGEPHTVIEIGPGTGIVTEELAKRAGRVIAIETNKSYARYLNKSFPGNNLTVYETSVENLPDIIRDEKNGGDPETFRLEAGVTNVPWTVLPMKLRRQIIMTLLSELEEGGKFIVYQHTKVADKTIKEVCAEIGALVDIQTFKIWKHLPPLIVTVLTLLDKKEMDTSAYQVA